MIKLKDETLLKNKCLIDGNWVGDETYDVLNPANGNLIAKVPFMGEKEAQECINAANFAQKPWAALTAKERSNILKNVIGAMDTKFVVNYFQKTADDRLIFGGGEKYSAIWANDVASFVRKNMLKIYPQLEKIKVEYAWGGALGIRQGETIPWALLSAHYRAPLDWGDDLLKQAQASLDRLYGAVLRLKEVAVVEAAPPVPVVEALADDLNTPPAIAELSALATAANIAKKPGDMVKAKGELLAAARLFGVLQDDPENWFRASFGEEAAEIDRLVAERIAARVAKDYALSDKLRDDLAARGVEVMDSASGSTWRRKG